jgi:drug/metabolite transporter (DMT)-like permease
MPSTKFATLLGVGAILLWATLASLTVATGVIPPFETTAIAFAIGGALVATTALLRGRAGLLRPTPASFALGLYGFFGYHALYFGALKLAPPAEASLITSLWALLTVLLSSLLPGHRLRSGHLVGAMLGLAAATMLIWDKLGAGGDTAGHRLGFTLAFTCAFVWSSYSVASRLLAAVPSESIAAPCLATSALAFACTTALERWVAPPDTLSWLALVGHRHEAGQRAAAGCALLRRADPVDGPAGGARPRAGDVVAGHCLRADGGGCGRRYARWMNRRVTRLLAAAAQREPARLHRNCE